jgi:hypothetical protein
MPRPQEGTGQTSGLRTALAHPTLQVRADYIAGLVKVYEETQDLTKTAKRFQASRRTLERAIRDFPELRRAIEATRNIREMFG